MKKTQVTTQTLGPIRRLSPWRVMLGIIILAGVTYSSLFGWKWWSENQAVAAYKPWFAPYIDVTATPYYPFEQLGSGSTRNAILSFIVASPNNSCTPTWGSYFTLEDASVKLDLDRRIARLKQQGGSIAISFGGLLNNELAVTCTDERSLISAYESVINRYDIDTIDLDLENNGLTNEDAALRRAKAIASLQAKRQTQGKSLSVWLTLPVTPQGLTPDGTTAVSLMLSHGVDITGLNVMAMDYGESRPSDLDMLDASKSALKEAQRQLGILYSKAGKNLTDTALWRKMGATVMIGQNDTSADLFTTEDAKGMNQFAQSVGIGRLSMWSINRDIPCGDNYVDLHIVSDSCSGTRQDKLGFTKILSNGFSGKLKNNVSIITNNDLKSTKQKPDDPEKSPYQIWTENGTYLKGAKVVWHQNVYEAKWWTQGDMPDNPVLQSYETPWQLLGPVLPGEKPLHQPTLPAGTYPEWSGTTEYDAGKRVLFQGVPYQAKWWTKGDSPAASSKDVQSSPWIPLTQEQVNQIIDSLK